MLVIQVEGYSGSSTGLCIPTTLTTITNDFKGVDYCFIKVEKETREASVRATHLSLHITLSSSTLVLKLKSTFSPLILAVIVRSSSISTVLARKGGLSEGWS